MAIQIITTVGTSIMTNYIGQFETSFFKEPNNHMESISTQYKKLEENTAKPFEKNKIIERLSKKWIKGIKKVKDANGNTNWELNNTSLNKNCCAEVQTIEAIAEKEEFKDEELHIHLLTTETQASDIAAQIIEKIYPNQENKRIKVVSIKEIKGLQVNDFTKFKNEGFKELMKEVKNILEPVEIIDRAYYLLSNNKKDNFRIEFINSTFKDELQNLVDSIITINDNKAQSNINSWSDYIETQPLLTQRNKVILNISGGYKAIIPLLTLLGQLYNIPLYYIYEDSQDLIELKKMPIDFDWVLANRCLPLLDKNKLKDTSYQNNTKYKSIFNLMEDNGLINKDFSITMIGELFRDYAIKYSPNQGLILGIFYEYLLFEYYHTFFKDIEVERSFFMCDKKKVNANEIDLRIEKSNQDVILIEAKGLGAILDEERRKEVKTQIIKKLKIWFNLNEGNKDKNKEGKSEYEIRNLVNYRLSIWTFEEFGNEIQEQKINIEFFLNEIKEEFNDRNIEFSVDYIPIKMSYNTEVGISKISMNKFLNKIEKAEDLKLLIGKPISQFITQKKTN
jgi:hypothetical protein